MRVGPSKGRHKVEINTNYGILTSLVLKFGGLYSKIYVRKRKQMEIQICCRHLSAAQYLKNGLLDRTHTVSRDPRCASPVHVISSGMSMMWWQALTTK